MKKISAVLLIATSIVHAEERRCVKERVVQRETCEEEKHPVVGAGLGWLVLGPIGAVAGAIAGSNGNKQCKTVEETQCVEWEIVKKH